VSIAGTVVVDGSGQPQPPPLVLESADSPNLEYNAVPEVDPSADGSFYYNAETWPGQSGQGVLLEDLQPPSDVKRDGNFYAVWFACLAILPLSPMP